MFYEAIGTLVEHAGETLTARHGDGRAKDVRDQREFRQITVLLKRVGAMWPHVFTSLEAELDVLDGTVQRARAAVPDLEPSKAAAGERSADPLKRYRQVLAELDELVVALHGRRDDRAAAAAIRDLRRGLAQAAEIQGRLVDLALAV